MLRFIVHPDVSKVRSAFVLKSWQIPELDTKMAAENQRNEVYTHHLHPTEGNLATSTHQSDKHTTDRNG